MITICMAWHHIGGFRKGTWPEALSVREVYIGYNLRMEVSVDFMNAVGSVESVERSWAIRGPGWNRGEQNLEEERESHPHRFFFKLVNSIRGAGGLLHYLESSLTAFFAWRGLRFGCGFRCWVCGYSFMGGKIPGSPGEEGFENEARRRAGGGRGL